MLGVSRGTGIIAGRHRVGVAEETITALNAYFAASGVLARLFRRRLSIGLLVE